jgi:hypothetical protein
MHCFAYRDFREKPEKFWERQAPPAFAYRSSSATSLRIVQLPYPRTLRQPAASPAALDTSPRPAPASPPICRVAFENAAFFVVASPLLPIAPMTKPMRQLPTPFL